MTSGAAAIIGVLLAAGRGRRMGGTKQLLPWPGPDGEKPLVAASFDAVATVCDRMIVVLGHEAERVAAALGARTFDTVSSSPDADMYESVRAGLRAVRAADPAAAALIQPADHPQVAPATLDAMLDAWRQAPERSVIPVHAGRGGHPVLVPAGLFDRLLGACGEGGLRRYWIDHPEVCARLEVDDPSILRDLDTPNGVGSL